MSSITFDPTINLGTLITFFGFVIGGLGVVFALRGQVSALVQRMALVEEEMRKVNEILVQVARQDERLTAIDRRLDDLSRGAVLGVKLGSGQ